MTGYRAFSYQFVKSFPVLSQGFEIETEMTIHALDKNLSLKSVPVEYRDRPEDSVSKLNTYSDGMRVLRTIARLYKEYRPLSFFGLFAALFGAAGLILFIPVLAEFFRTGLVPRFPTLIVSGVMMTLPCFCWYAASFWTPWPKSTASCLKSTSTCSGSPTTRRHDNGQAATLSHPRAFLCAALGVASAMCFVVDTEGYVGMSALPAASTSYLWSALALCFALLLYHVHVRRGIRAARGRCFRAFCSACSMPLGAWLFAYDSWAMLASPATLALTLLRSAGQAVPMASLLTWVDAGLRGGALYRPGTLDDAPVPAALRPLRRWALAP